MLRPEGFLYLLFINFIKVGSMKKLPQLFEFWEYTEYRDLCLATTLNEYNKCAYQRRTEKEAPNNCWVLLGYMWKYLVQLSLDKLRKVKN